MYPCALTELVHNAQCRTVNSDHCSPCDGLVQVPETSLLDNVYACGNPVLIISVVDTSIFIAPMHTLNLTLLTLAQKK